MNPSREDPPREAGVLCLLYRRSDDLHLVLTRRSDALERHSAQISFPGGAREADEPIERTAVRETEEEIGVAPQEVRIIGGLTPLYVSVSHFMIHPFVGWADRPPTFRPDPWEVAEVLEIPLRVLSDPATLVTEVWNYHGSDHEVPFFAVGSHKIWGATAMILGELLEVLRRARNP